MTSEVLRKILVAGAAFAALSVVACSKPAPAAASDTSTVASDVAPASDVAASDTAASSVSGTP
jgi:uncharacterized protein YcfL